MTPMPAASRMPTSTQTWMRRRLTRTISLLPRRFCEGHQFTRFQTAGDLDAIPASSFNLNSAFMEGRSIPNVNHCLSGFEERRLCRNSDGIWNAVDNDGDLHSHAGFEASVRREN